MLEMIRMSGFITCVLFLSCILILYIRGHWDYTKSIFSKIRVRGIDGYMRMTQDFAYGMGTVKSGSHIPTEEMINFHLEKDSADKAPEKLPKTAGKLMGEKAADSRPYHLKIMG